jgi:hypothetical protein
MVRYFDGSVRQLIATIRSMAASFASLAEIYTQALDIGKAEDITDRYPELDAAFWRILERYGRGQISQETLFLEVAALLLKQGG